MKDGEIYPIDQIMIMIFELVVLSLQVVTLRNRNATDSIGAESSMRF